MSKLVAIKVKIKYFKHIKSRQKLKNYYIKKKIKL